MKEIFDLLTKLEEESLISKKKYNLLTNNCLTISKTQAPLDWPAVRKLFFEKNRKNFEVEPMNSANLCPTFQPVIQAIHDFRIDFNQDISMQKRQYLFGYTMKYTKKALARHLGLGKNGYKNLAIKYLTSINSVFHECLFPLYSL